MSTVTHNFQEITLSVCSLRTNLLLTKVDNFAHSIILLCRLLQGLRLRLRVFSHSSKEALSVAYKPFSKNPGNEIFF
jgi:hypothetical protein